MIPLPCQESATQSRSVRCEVTRGAGVSIGAMRAGRLLYFTAVPRGRYHYLIG